MCVCVCVCVFGSSPVCICEFVYAGFMKTQAQRDCRSEEQLYRDQTPSGGYISPPAERQPQCDPRRGEFLPSRESSDGGTIRGSTLLRSPLLRGQECVCVCFYLMLNNWSSGWADKKDKIETICRGETFREVRGSHYVETMCFFRLRTSCWMKLCSVCVCVCVCAVQCRKEMLYTVGP